MCVCVCEPREKGGGGGRDPLSRGKSRRKWIWKRKKKKKKDYILGGRAWDRWSVRQPVGPLPGNIKVKEKEQYKIVRGEFQASSIASQASFSGQFPPMAALLRLRINGFFASPYSSSMIQYIHSTFRSYTKPEYMSYSSDLF